MTTAVPVDSTNVPRTEEFKPYRWQHEAREALNNGSWSAGKGKMVVAATGTGKTAFGHYLAESYLARGDRVLWIAHRKELIDQPLAALKRWYPQFDGGIVRGKLDQCDKQMVYASKASLHPSRLAQYLSHGRPNLVIVDEVHHSASKGWRTLLEALGILNVTSFGPAFVGITATPDREDNARLSELWEIAYSYPILDAISDGVLVPPYATYAPLPDLNLAEVSCLGGDYNAEELERALQAAHIVEKTVEAVMSPHRAERLPLRDEGHFFKKGTDGELVFTLTVKQAQETAKQLTEAGRPARAVWGEMPPADREAALQAFTDGQVHVLCNAGVLTEGTDLPRAKRAYLARPTKSWALYVQILGRLLRRYGDWDKALLVDLCGASQMHSIICAPVLVDGTDCESSMDGKHRYLKIEGTNEGRCQDCGITIPCFKSKGGHVYKDHSCKRCGATQCSDSPDKAHSWVPWGKSSRACVYCAMEIPDPMAAMLNKKRPDREPVAWGKLEVPESPVTIWGVNLGPSGVLYNVELGNNRFMPYLLARHEMRPLAPRPVDATMSRMLTDSVASRTKKTAGFFGGQTSRAAARMKKIVAEHAAAVHRIWEVRSELR